MIALQLRKKTLLLESDLNRLTLHAEWQRLHEATRWTGYLKETRLGIGAWALALAMAPLAGAAVVLGLRRVLRGGHWWIKALAAVPSIIQLWRSAVARSSEAK